MNNARRALQASVLAFFVLAVSIFAQTGEHYIVLEGTAAEADVFNVADNTEVSVIKGGVCAWSQTPSRDMQVRSLPSATADQKAASTGHPPDIRTGRKISSGMGGGQQAAILAGIFGTVIATTLLVHDHKHVQPSADDLKQKGPQMPHNVSMSHLIVDGLIGPGWPVGVDFQLEGPGSLFLDITTSKKVQYHQELTNNLQGRGITITRLPDDLPSELQPATFDIEAVAPAGSNGPPPNVRIYGLAAGPKAVGSIAIDQLEFGPANVNRGQEAQYGFHSHFDFSEVRADFMFTGLKDHHIIMKQDNETPLNPVDSDEHAHGSFQTKGTAGQHLLQIRAWRGNSGDWVVAWSPDVVTLTK